MQLRILIPPNLAACAARDAIPTKLELRQGSGKLLPPEKATPDALAELDEKGRVAAFAIFQWCGGKLSSFLQLSKEQLAQIIGHLQGEDAFFWANRPTESIPWNGSLLEGVSALVEIPPIEASDEAEESNRDDDVDLDDDAPSLADFDGTPMEVDGSQHYLAVSLPSREHPCYAEIRELLESYRFKLEPSNRKWWLRDRHQTLNFLGERWDDLEARYGAEFSDNFKERLGTLPEATVRSEVQEARNGYTLSVAVSAGDAAEQTISQSLNSGKRYIETGSQTFLIKQSQLRKLHRLQKNLADAPDAPLLHRGTYSIPFAKSVQVEDDLNALNPNFRPPDTWRERSQALKDLSLLPTVPLPETLTAILRPYQKIGVAWLYHLFRNDLGGILADEMGLGKTLQALALLQTIKGRRPSLVVCPATLVENWRREAVRFCPELNLQVHHGSGRSSSAKELEGSDLLITSYGTLNRDEALFASLNFNCVVADEAQHIKNRKSQNAKAVCTLSTRGRILLTGTPVENSLQDLQSLLDFILPGGWKPIPRAARGEDRRWHERRILEQAAPYILRRSKKAVAPELPEKIEQVVYMEMTSAQRRLYESARRAGENEISLMEEKGASEGAVRMKTLTQLLRLRQICCDPRIVDNSAEARSSAKLASFVELLEESIDGGHRLLVFSQFVSTLSLLKETLQEQDIDFCYLDGSTRDRMAVVDQFNGSESIPLFLISLKAGGTGLNLTSADTVVHYDPWWNPAAEAQATDRAHRIGQTRVVTSYKLIVADSVEEKVLQLQQSKRKLLEDIFEASDAANAKITLADLKALF